MEKVIQSLQEGTYALLESPTGTGKTLSLLCACLGWQYAQKTNPSDRRAKLAHKGRNTSQRAPVIIYSSRTHSQLAQVVKEIKACFYNPRITILGSRKQLCIHPEVSQMPPSQQNSVCRAMVAKRSCEFKLQADQESQSSSSGPHSQQTAFGVGIGAGDGNQPVALDIEELSALGRETRTCPFYYSRDAQATAEIVLMPYNYLLAPAARKALNVDWKNAVIIFDEVRRL